MTNIDFDVLRFYPLLWDEFVRRYSGSIQPTVIWKKIVAPHVGLTILAPGQSIDLVWYKGGDWRDGEPRHVRPGKAKALIRIPAVKVKRKLIALDGCHRLTQLRPQIVLVDWFSPRHQDRVYINDLFNRHHA